MTWSLFVFYQAFGILKKEQQSELSEENLLFDVNGRQLELLADVPMHYVRL